MSPGAETSPTSQPETVELTGRYGKRSRRGCWTCRSPQVKKRCDEQRPVCGRCSRLNILCDYSARLTKAERRKAERSSQPTASHGNPPDLSLSIVTVSAPRTGACSLELSDEDHEAIRYFRTAFAKSHHTKNPDYSLISIMFTLAQEEPMIMHMVLSLGMQEMDIRRHSQTLSRRRDPLQHYAAALSLLADAVAPDNGSQDLDVIYTALWLMLLYEQQFGDSECKAYTKHLEGTSSLLQHRSQQLCLPPSPSSMPMAQTPVLSRHLDPQRNLHGSVYSARILVWIALLDAAAASSGVGGHVNAALFRKLVGNNTQSTTRSTSPVEAFSRFHRFSNPLYRMQWGDKYPQAELLDDVENRNIYALLGQCSQLRYMVAQLAVLYQKDSAAATQKAPDVDSAIEQVGYLFTELMEVAIELSPHTDNSHRLVANIRAIVPMYYAVLLDFMRLTNTNEPLGDRQRLALREIMNLAYQSYKHDGDAAMTRVAWPLFIAALETDDLLHRDWIVERFAAISNYGKNFERAHRFLLGTIPLQQQLGRRIDLREQLASTEHFVL
ncbi:fungal-specific transcription factor domain-containing protein [Lophiotrema nucula]|uniref:Fungal-specific transcription factor domain-containing protein n=1 Tax=Lophiotrema nucula TaxID=690887 RepID=A0A6A5ZEH6_9PLEO|nr:fungal-specific transcription factor domain-containing protein [Lophiotrema nucula]